jgi:hypothetical protein
MMLRCHELAVERGSLNVPHLFAALPLFEAFWRRFQKAAVDALYRFFIPHQPIGCPTFSSR